MNNFIFPNKHNFDPKGSIYSLPKSFYKGMRSIINEKSLEKLEELAKNIPEPELFGTYRDESHYLKTLDLMLRSTDETRERGLFIKRAILPLLKSHDKLLDIGAGSGQLLCWIGNSFKYATAIDINRESINALNVNKHILHSRVFLEKIHGSLFDAQFHSNYYDLTLLSHVLYYVQNNRWLEAIEIAYRATRINGFIIVALSGDGFGKADLIRYFDGCPIEIDKLFDKCRFRFGEKNTTIFVSKELIFSKSLLSMMHIAGFFLRDVGVTVVKELLLQYIKKKHQKNKNLYIMSSQQKFIVIKKQ